MDKKIKDTYLTLRISSTEKSEIAKDALAQGHGDTSAFILWLYRKFGRRNKNG